jgi:hypothetical protein
MKQRLYAVVLLATLACAVLLGPLSAAAASREAPAAATQGINVPVNFTSALGSFTGTFNITRFAVQNGQILAIGTLTGTVTNAVGTVIGTVNQALTLPVLAISGSCQILHLELGPLDLNLLGLQVHLDRVVLDITAQSGPGNLLGNLLCAVAHLLDNNGPLSTIVGLLNNILRQL